MKTMKMKMMAGATTIPLPTCQASQTKSLYATNLSITKTRQVCCLHLHNESSNIPTINLIDKFWMRADFPVGEVIHVLVGVINTSPEDYNVTFAMGSVNHPVDLAFYIQNVR